MKVRKAVQSDLDDILNLFRETVMEINKQDYTDEQVEAWASSSKDEERWLKKLNDQYFLVAEEGGEITGFGSITPEGYLDTMFVHKNHQRKGVAKALIHALIDYAVRNQVKEIITDGSITARSFFERHGFEVIKKQEVNRKGIEIVNFKMRKQLE